MTVVADKTQDQTQGKGTEGAGAGDGKGAAGDGKGSGDGKGADDGKKGEGSILGDAKGGADGKKEDKTADKTGEGKKDDKTDDTKKTEAPDKYTDFKLPEGVKLDAKVVESFTVIAKKHNLSQEAAQEMVDLQTSYAASREKEIADGYNKQREDWQAKSKELLGANPGESLGHAARALDRFGGTELRQLLNESGLGDHPLLTKAFIEIGKMIGEDKQVEGASATGDTRTDAEVLYPNMGKKK